MQFQKISILHPRKGLEVGGSVRPKNLKTCMKLNWNFQRGGGWGLRKHPFSAGGMDIFWNYMVKVAVPKKIPIVHPDKYFLVH